MARLVVSAVVGVAVGYFLGPQAGLQAFALTYGTTGFLDPSKKVLGPKLNDLKAPTASYGAPISYIEGAPRLAGNVIWASSKREVATTTSEGKGGPGVDSTTFTYEIDLGIELGINRCQALRRVFSNGKLVWSKADDADGETLAASSATNSWRDLRFYDGDPQQLPDPTYEALVGVGNAPAYRTRTTVVIEGLNLGGSGQLPVLTFEVLSESAGSFDVVTENVCAAVAPFTLGTPAFSLDQPFDVMVGGLDTVGGSIFSLDVYTVDLVAGTTELSGRFSVGTYNWGTALGNSDESCILLEQAGGTPVDFRDLYFPDGSHVRLDTSDNGSAAHIFSKVADDLVLAVASLTVGDRKLRRYQRSTGTLLVTAAVAMPQDIQSVAIGGSFVYSLGDDGTALYKSDLSTLDLIETIAIPADYTATSGQVVCDGSTPYVFGAGSVPWQEVIVKWTGAIWEPIAYAVNGSGVAHEPDPTPELSDLYAEPVNSERFGFSGGIFFSQKFDTDHVNINYLLDKVRIVLPTLDQVVRRLCLRTGQLTDDDIDVTDLSHDVAIADGRVRALAVSQVSTTRATLEILMGSYLFECVESDTLRFVRRGGNSVATIPFEDMGASDDGMAEPLPLKRVNDIEAAARVSVKYANTLNDFQDGLEAADRLVTESTAEQVIELPLGFQPSEAKKLADANTLDLAVTLIQIGPVALTRKYAHLEPTDVVTLTNQDGSTFRARIAKGTIGGGLLTFDLVLDDATVINSAAETDDDYVSSTLIRLLSDSDLEILDIPILRDEDNALGPYVAIGAGAKWSASQVDKSDDGVTFAKVATVTARSVVGEATTTLPDFAGGFGTFDDLSVVRVDVGGNTLESVSKAEALLGNAPAYLIGEEIVYACTATFVSAGIYDLSVFLRGLLGTEWAMPDHAAAERVVLLEATGLRKITDDATDLDVERFYRATTIGKAASPTGESFTDTGVALMPFAPVDLIVSRASGFQIQWHRRSRLASSLFGGDPPLGEATEAYDVELRNASDVLMDAGTVTVPHYNATALALVGTAASYFWGLKVIGSDLVAMGFDRFTSSKPNNALVVLDADGVVLETTANIGQRAIQWANDGSALYALSETYSADLSTAISTQVQKFTIGTLASVDATNTAASFGDYQGLAFDGTDIWVSEPGSNLLRRLDKSTLVSIATYAVTGGPSTLFYLAGKLWVCCGATDELVRFDTTAHTEDFRVAVAGGLFDVYVNADVAVTAGYGNANTFDATTGALIATYTGLFFTSADPQRTLVEFDGSIVIGVQSPLFAVGGGAQAVLVVVDAATGLETQVIQMLGDIQLFFLSGTDGTDLFISSRLVLEIATRRYQLAPPNLTGYTFTVWQKSATVGRGYPAILEL